MPVLEICAMQSASMTGRSCPSPPRETSSRDGCERNVKALSESNTPRRFRDLTRRVEMKMAENTVRRGWRRSESAVSPCMRLTILRTSRSETPGTSRSSKDFSGLERFRRKNSVFCTLHVGSSNERWERFAVTR